MGKGISVAIHTANLVPGMIAGQARTETSSPVATKQPCRCNFFVTKSEIAYILIAKMQSRHWINT